MSWISLCTRLLQPWVLGLDDDYNLQLIILQSYLSTHSASDIIVNIKWCSIWGVQITVVVLVVLTVVVVPEVAVVAEMALIVYYNTWEIIGTGLSCW